MIDGIALAGLIVGMAALWIWYFKALEILNRYERKVKDLHNRIVTLEDYTFGTNCDTHMWRD